MAQKKDAIILSLMIFSLLAVNYSFLDKSITGFFIEEKFVHVDRIIDGDTIESENQSIRLLGINTPERKEEFYSEAKEFLESEILNKTVRLEFGKERKDRYNRTLAYIFLGNKNINLEIVENGFANYYFPSGKDIYYDDFEQAWNSCIEKNINLCEKSKDVCSECIELKNLDFKKDEAVFYNSCEFSCDLSSWSMKDEGRKKFAFPNFGLDKGKEVMIKVGEEENTENVLFWKGESYVWTKTGDTLFLRDEEGKLVLWKGY